MHQKSWPSYVVLASMLLAPVSILPGCSVSPIGEVRTVLREAKGSLSLVIRGIDLGRQVQATTADIDRLEVMVTSDSGSSQVRTLNRSQLLDERTIISFSQLPEGIVMVALKVYDGVSSEIGSSTAAVQIRAGQSTSVELMIQLAPTYILAPDSLAISVTFRDGPVIHVPANSPSETPAQQPVRLVAAQNHGLIYLWDTVLRDRYLLKSATAGLGETAARHSSAFENSRVLYQAGDEIYYYDIYSEERVTVAFDARDPSSGGAKPVVTQSGSSIAYINNQGLIVRKLRDGDFYTKTRILSKVFSEVGAAEDIDVSDDEKLLVVSSSGRIHLYDLIADSIKGLELDANPEVLASFPQDLPYIQDVAVSGDGRFIAFTAYGRSAAASEARLFKLDRVSGQVSEVPNMPSATPVDAKHFTSLSFAGGTLYFVLGAGDDASLWTHDPFSHVSQLVVSLRELAAPN